MGNGLLETTRASRGEAVGEYCLPDLPLKNRSATASGHLGARKKPRSCGGPERSQVPRGEPAFGNSLGRSVSGPGWHTYLIGVGCRGCAQAAVGDIAAPGRAAGAEMLRSGQGVKMHPRSSSWLPLPGEVLEIWSCR